MNAHGIGRYSDYTIAKKAQGQLYSSRTVNQYEAGATGLNGWSWEVGQVMMKYRI